MTLFTITLMFCLKLSAPPNQSLIIFEGESVRPYNAILKACVQIESSGNRFAYNSKEEARGILQITPVRLIDYNRKSGKHYSRQDCFNVEISKEIYLYYADKSGPYDLDKIVRDWNGSGAMTFEYLKKVKKLL